LVIYCQKNSIMLRIVPHSVPRVGRSYEHFPDGFELHLLQGLSYTRRARQPLYKHTSSCFTNTHLKLLYKHTSSCFTKTHRVALHTCWPTPPNSARGSSPRVSNTRQHVSNTPGGLLRTRGCVSNTRDSVSNTPASVPRTSDGRSYLLANSTQLLPRFLTPNLLSSSGFRV